MRVEAVRRLPGCKPLRDDLPMRGPQRTGAQRRSPNSVGKDAFASLKPERRLRAGGTPRRGSFQFAPDECGAHADLRGLRFPSTGSRRLRLLLLSPCGISSSFP